MTIDNTASSMVFNTFELCSEVFQYLLNSGDIQARRVCTGFKGIFDDVIKRRINYLTQQNATSGLNVVPAYHSQRLMGSTAALKEFNQKILKSAGLPLTQETQFVTSSKLQEHERNYNQSLLVFWEALTAHLNFEEEEFIPQTPSEIKEWLANSVNQEKLQEIEGLNINDPKLTVLPGEIALLTNLKTLNLSNTSIQFLCPQIVDLSSLEYLDVSGTQLKKLPEGFENFVNLRILNVDGTPVMKSLPDSLETLKNLKLKTIICKTVQLKKAPALKLAKQGLVGQTATNINAALRFANKKSA